MLFSSRDGRIAVWSVNETLEDNQKIIKCEQKSLLTLKDSITSLDFSRYNLLKKSEQYLLGVGFESGKIHLYSWNSAKESSEHWELIKLLDNRYSILLVFFSFIFKPKHSRKIGLNINYYFFFFLVWPIIYV